MFLRSFQGLSKNDAFIAGGKGASLGEMTQAGIPVPSGFVILADAFEAFLGKTDLGVEIDSILHNVDTEKMHTVEHASETIQKLILEAGMPGAISMEISEAFKKLDAKFVAVRSSATAEDSVSAAWAGQLDSFLNTTEESLLKNVQRCWASLFTSRAIFYRFEKDLHKTKISVAVVIQKMVESEVSGIAFSVHPVTEDHNQLIIEAGFGLGEAIVSGQITPDSYVVEKIPRRIIDRNISEQTKLLTRKENGGNDWTMVSYSKRQQQKLSDEQISELSEIIVKIEDHYGFPCDIEWAYESGRFYIVQSRPITTLGNLFTGEDSVGAIVKDKDKKRGILNNPSLSDYQKMFQWKGHFSYFLNSFFMGVYAELEVLSLCDGLMWQSYIPIRVKEKTLVDGMEIYGSKDNYAELKNGIVIGYQDLRSLFETTLKKRLLTKEDVTRCFDESVKYYSYYSKTEFFYTDKVFEEQDRNEQVKVSLASFDSLKMKGREQLNQLALIQDNYLDRLLQGIGRQFNIRIEDLRNYAMHEIVELFDGVPTLSRNELSARTQAYFVIGDRASSESIFSKDAQAILRGFLAEIKHKHELFGQVANKKKPIRGRARVFRLSVSEIERTQEMIDRMERGEVLVADTTAPEIITACKKASAIVTNQGGMLSHAAIISRELGIPCVVGTGYATEIIHDGDLIEVDAEDGVVRILDRVENGRADFDIYEKLFTRDTSLVVFEVWYDAFTKGTVDLFGKNPVATPIIDYMCNGLVDIYENKMAMQWFKDQLLEWSSVNEKSCLQAMKKYESGIKSLSDIYEKQQCDTSQELIDFINRIESLYVGFAIIA